MSLVERGVGSRHRLAMLRMKDECRHELSRRHDPRGWTARLSD